MSLGYNNQDGIVVFDHDKYERLTYRTNLNVNLTERLRIGTNLQLTYATQDALSSSGDEPGIIRHALLRPPVIGVYKNPNDPTYSVRDPFTDLPFYKFNDKDAGGWESDKYEWSQNPIALAYFTDDVRKNFGTFGNIYAEYSFLKDKELAICFTDSHNTPNTISKNLKAIGMKGKMYVGYNLSYETEKIEIKDIGEQFSDISSLAVVVIENEMD